MADGLADDSLVASAICFHLQTAAGLDFGLLWFHGLYDFWALELFLGHGVGDALDDIKRTRSGWVVASRRRATGSDQVDGMHVPCISTWACIYID